jgi:hypothetical protein
MQATVRNFGRRRLPENEPGDAAKTWPLAPALGTVE